jgi:protein-S-isoprenylcysteine O-methyltransferase Ste14
MWGVARTLPSRRIAGPARIWIALAVAALAVVIALAAVAAFLRARTTINPTTLPASSSLVTAGVFGISRNPMYLSLLSLLVAWAVFLCSPWGRCGSAAIRAVTAFRSRPRNVYWICLAHSTGPTS